MKKDPIGRALRKAPGKSIIIEHRAELVRQDAVERERLRQPQAGDFFSFKDGWTAG